MSEPGACQQCGRVHVASGGGRPCLGHVVTDRDSYVKGQGRKPLPEPRPCKRRASRGLDVCHMHGAGAAHVRAAGEQRAAEAKAVETARKLIPDADQREPIRNPLQRLLELASEADALRESLRLLANKVGEQITTGRDSTSVRAEIATYRSALKDVTDLLVAIARLDVETMLARVESRKVEFVIAALTGGMDDAGLNNEQKRAVMTGVTRHLRSVPRPAA